MNKFLVELGNTTDLVDYFFTKSDLLPSAKRLELAISELDIESLTHEQKSAVDSALDYIKLVQDDNRNEGEIFEQLMRMNRCLFDCHT